MNTENQPIVILPGDVVSVKLPGKQPGHCPKCLVRVLDREPKKKGYLVGIVMDLFFFIGSADAALKKTGGIIEFDLDSIEKVFNERVGEKQPDIAIVIRNGSVATVHRTDGKVDPIVVKVIDEDDKTTALYNVDAVRTKLITEPSGGAEVQDLFEFIEES